MIPTFGAQAKKLRSFALASQFFPSTFEKVEKETNVKLENIVFVKSKQTYYSVMTVTRKSLFETNILKDTDAEDLLNPKNIDHDIFDRVVRSVMGCQFVQDAPAVLEALERDNPELCVFGAQLWRDKGPTLFDFSKTCRADAGLKFAEEADSPTNLLVALVGDALIEPFWPEGLGIIRGFFSVLDACYAFREWAVGKSTQEVQQGYSACQRELEKLNAQMRASVLRPVETAYRLHPGTRYKYL